jgi:hypothetical protein
MKVTSETLSKLFFQTASFFLIIFHKDTITNKRIKIPLN